MFALLIQLAEAAPDTALLSVNTIQKGLSDPNAQNRALALRTMSSIRVPVISQIVALGIKRGAADMSPLVRRTAALAIPKCYGLDPGTKSLLIEQIALLLGDKQYFVAGAAVVAFLDVCPERIDLVHPFYRGLIKKLVDMDEWGQIATLELMIQYGRKCFPRRTKSTKGKDPEGAASESTITLDPDLEILLEASKPLLQSRNSAVIVAVARCFLYLGTPVYVSQIAGPLISTLRSSPDISSQTMHTIVSICQLYPTTFVPYTNRFLLSASDPPAIITSKLTLLSLLFPHVSSTLRSLILTDIAQHTKSSDPSTVRAAVLAIGRCASSAPTAPLRTKCLRLLLTHLSSLDSTLVSASLDEIRSLIQRDAKAHAKTIVRLARHLDALTAPRARAAIVWLVGEFAATEESPRVAADVWRILLKDFANESEIVQGQVLLLGAKVYLHYQRGKETSKTLAEDQPSDSTAVDELKDDGRIPRMLEHTFLLARYAHSYTLRDRARYLKALVLGSPNTDLGALLLLAEKPLGQADTDRNILDGKEEYPVGNASQILGVPLRGAEKVPPWTTVEVGAAERKGATTQSEAASSISSVTRSTVPVVGGYEAPAKKPNGGPSKTLDQWLDEEDEEGESEEETDEESSGEEESEEESGEEEESEYETDESEGEQDRLVKS